MQENQQSKRQRHKIACHYLYHECKVCGAKRNTGYKPWAYGYGQWHKANKRVGQWCPGPEGKLRVDMQAQEV